MRKTAGEIVAAFNRMDVDAIMSYRAPECRRYLFPSSMSLDSQDNATYAASLHQLRTVFSNFSLKMTDLIEDCDSQRICLWLAAKADTAAGLYLNEYVWLLEFDELGEHVTKTNEFSDSSMAKDFFPKLRIAMTEAREK